MSLSPSQCRAIINDIALAASAAALAELRRLTRREYGRDLDGSFAELLMDFRLEKLAHDRGMPYEVSQSRSGAHSATSPSRDHHL